MEDKLKPCPFCGSPAEYIERVDDYGFVTGKPGTIEHVIECSNRKCPVVFLEATGKTYDDAVKNWNTRDTWANRLPDKQKVIDFLKELLESCRVRSNNADEEYSLVEELLKNLN